MAVRIGSVEADRPAIGGPDQIEAAALVGFVALACFELILDIRIAAVADQRAGRIAVAAVADDQWLEAAQPLGDAEHIAILEAAALRILAVDRDLEFGGGAPLDRADQPVADLRRLLGAEAARRGREIMVADRLADSHPIGGARSLGEGAVDIGPGGRLRRAFARPLDRKSTRL